MYKQPKLWWSQFHSLMTLSSGAGHLGGRVNCCLPELLTGRKNVATVRVVCENRLLVEMVYRRF